MEVIKREGMEVIKLNCWEDFEKKVAEDKEKFKATLEKEKRYKSEPYLLFRGHSNACWRLETTLERFCQDRGIKNEWSWKKYYDLLRRIYPALASLMSNQTLFPSIPTMTSYEDNLHEKINDTDKSYRPTYCYELPDFKEEDFRIPDPKVPPGYELMVYMRHHGFPSPLMDWTRSYYIAGFFAFKNATGKSNVAILSFREFCGNMKNWDSGPQIWTAGPYIKTHARHYHQQCEYTHCYKVEQNHRIYCSHENIRYGPAQDILKKYILPARERKKVLAMLHLMNINAYTLFGSEEGLMDMLAYREIEKD